MLTKMEFGQHHPLGKFPGEWPQTRVGGFI